MSHRWSWGGHGVPVGNREAQHEGDDDAAAGASDDSTDY